MSDRDETRTRGPKRRDYILMFVVCGLASLTAQWFIEGGFHTVAVALACLVGAIGVLILGGVRMLIRRRRDRVGRS